MKDRFLKYLEDSLPEYIELEKERQEEMEATKRKHSGEDATTAKRMKSRQVQGKKHFVILSFSLHLTSHLNFTGICGSAF